MYRYKPGSVNIDINIYCSVSNPDPYIKIADPDFQERKNYPDSKFIPGSIYLFASAGQPVPLLIRIRAH